MHRRRVMDRPQATPPSRAIRHRLRTRLDNELFPTGSLWRPFLAVKQTKYSVVALIEESSSHQTLCWRKEDSNRWSHLRVSTPAAPARCRQPPASELNQ
jgi:hypothetical protein